MKNAILTHIPIKITATLFSFIFSCFLCMGNDVKKANVITNIKHLIEQEAEENDRVAALLDSLEYLSVRKNIPDEELVRTTTEVSGVFRMQGKLTLAIELFFNVISYYEQISNPDENEVKSLVQLYIPMGAAHEELGMGNRAMDFYLKALTLSEEYGLDSYRAMVYNNIGAIHYSRRDFKKAEKYMLDALEINKELNIKKEIFNNYNNLAGVYANFEDYSKALDCALMAIQQLDKDKNADLYYFEQSNIAALYIYTKNFELAYTYLNNAMQHQLKSGFDTDLIQTYALMSKVYENTGKPDSARIYMERSLANAQKIGNKNIESRIQRDKAILYKKYGNYREAYDALMVSYMLNDSLTQIDNQRKMNDLEMVYDAEKKMRDNELIIKDITLQKLNSDRRWTIAVCVGLFLILVMLYLVHLSRAKERSRRTNELLAEQQVALLEKEKELQKQKEQELNFIIDKKNRELTSYTINMVKNNEFIADFSDELKQLLLEMNPKDRQHKEHVRQMLHKLHHQNNDSNWEEFHYYFEQVHPSFYRTLELRYPDITTKEKRLCAFLRLGLSSKEISAITFREVRSVESARNRLRKKLGLNPDGNLTEFLTSFSHQKEMNY